MIATGGIEIANMSLGCRVKQKVHCQQLTNSWTELINAGVTMFISAGNDYNETINDDYCGVDAFICVSALSDTDGKCGGQGPLVRYCSWTAGSR